MSDAEGGKEKSHLGGRGRVLLLAKTRSRSYDTLLIVGVGIFFLLGGAFFAIIAVTEGIGPFLLLGGAVGVIGALIIGLGVLISVLRVAVTSEELRVRWCGMWGPRIPIADILECGVEKYDTRKYADGGAIGLIDGRWHFVNPTAENRVVCVRWRDGKKEKQMVFSSEQPDAVLAAIRKAMAMRAGGGGFRMRVDPREPTGELDIENEERDAKRRMAE